MYVVIVGWYDDQMILGVAADLEQAGLMINRARWSGLFKALEGMGPDDSDDYRTVGPFPLGEVYDWKGNVL